MWAEAACRALRNGKCLELRYDGFRRIVEVHAVGVSKAGNICMSVWQVRGGSESNEPEGWKFMRVDEASSAAEIDEQSQAPRTGYVRDSKQFERIICQLDATTVTPFRR